MKDKIKCEGCYDDEECKGEVVAVLVSIEGGEPWEFNYCEASIESDRANGFTVTIKDPENEQPNNS